jgi:hypothetical protein
VTLTRTQLILVAVAAVLLLLVVFVAGRGCGPMLDGGGEPITTGIDAGPGEAVIAERLDAAVQAGEARMEAIEEKFADDLAAFDARQHAEYEALRGGDDLEAAAELLSSWSRTRRRDGGT